MRHTIFSHQPLQASDNSVEIFQTDTDTDHLGETIEELQQAGQQIDAWTDESDSSDTPATERTNKRS